MDYPNTVEAESDAPLKPPTADIDGNRWYAAPSDDPLVRRLTERFGAAANWQVTRLFGAAYAYREPSGETLVAKFYSAKTKILVEHYAEREKKAIERARQVLGESVVPVLEHFRGVLLMPYVAGLSLQSAIAVRRNEAGSLSEKLVRIAKLLARLHAATIKTGPSADFTPAVAYGHKLVQNLADYGVLAGDPLTGRALEALIVRWSGRAVMHDFVPTFVHGDVTTGNFLFPVEPRVVALDWERAQLADPAQDLGRLAAEVTHSIVQHGGTVAEALNLVDDFSAAYCAELNAPWSREAISVRARFYRAISSLRIARNTWSPRSQRAQLVGHALALLSAE